MIRTTVACFAGCLLAASPPDIAHGDPKDGRAHRPANLEPVETPFGRTGDPKQVSRTVRIDGGDTMRFAPASLTVRQGQTVRFVVRNTGKLVHELVLGTLDELQRHAEWMRRFPNMEHESPYMVHLAPGQSGQIIWQFTQPGEFHFGGLVPGHFDAAGFGWSPRQHSDRCRRRPARPGGAASRHGCTDRVVSSGPLPHLGLVPPATD